MTKYTDLLRDPRWQKKRLEIMQRDGFACTHCDDTKTTLNVHHCYYAQGKMPWDYEDASLMTLCEDCHKKKTYFLRIMKNGLSEEMGKHGAMSIHYHELAMGFFKLEPGRFEKAIWFIEFFLNNKQVQDYFFSIADRAIADSQQSEVAQCPTTA